MLDARLIYGVCCTIQTQNEKIIIRVLFTCLGIIKTNNETLITTEFRRFVSSKIVFRARNSTHEIKLSKNNSSRSFESHNEQRAHHRAEDSRFYFWIQLEFYLQLNRSDSRVVNVSTEAGMKVMEIVLVLPLSPFNLWKSCRTLIRTCGFEMEIV